MSVLIQSGLPCTDCGSSDAKAIYSSNTYCFSCGKSKPTNRPLYSHKKPISYIPCDLTHNLPLPYREWLEVVGIKKYDCLSYSPKLDALVISMTNAKGEIVGRHVRSLGERKAWNVGKKGCALYGTLSDKSIVLVEDIRSALKLYNCGYNTLCLLGTSLPRDWVNKLAADMDNIYIWLDDDEAGQKAAKIIFDKLKLCSIVKNIRTKNDPKWYSETEIFTLI